MSRVAGNSRSGAADQGDLVVGSMTAASMHLLSTVHMRYPRCAFNSSPWIAHMALFLTPPATCPFPQLPYQTTTHTIQ
jgi:hypothetical protein